MPRLIVAAALICLTGPAFAAPPAPATEQVVVHPAPALDAAYVHPEDGAAAVPVADDDTLPNSVSVLDSQEN